MELILKRTRFNEFYTSGQMYLNGAYFCFTLEDKITEIPNSGTMMYKVSLKDTKLGPDTICVGENAYIHAGKIALDNSIIIGYKINKIGLILPGTTKICINDLKYQIRNAEETILRIMN